MSSNNISRKEITDEEVKEIAQAVICLINLLEEREIPAWTTTIQKVIFLWLLSKNKAKKFYRAYLYGPYSDFVSGIVTRLQALKYLDCDVSVFQTVTRSYHVNKEKIPSDILQRLKKKYIDLQDILNNLINNNCLTDVKSISNIAKIAWIEDFENVDDLHMVQDLIKNKYLWNLSESDINIAYNKWNSIKNCLYHTV